MLHAENQTEKKEEKSFCNFLLEMLYSVAPPCGWYWLLHIELNQTSVNIHSPLGGFAVIFQVKYTGKIFTGIRAQLNFFSLVRTETASS